MKLVTLFAATVDRQRGNSHSPSRPLLHSLVISVDVGNAEVKTAPLQVLRRLAIPDISHPPKGSASKGLSDGGTVHAVERIFGIK